MGYVCSVALRGKQNLSMPECVYRPLFGVCAKKKRIKCKSAINANPSPIVDQKQLISRSAPRFLANCSLSLSLFFSTHKHEMMRCVRTFVNMRVHVSNVENCVRWNAQETVSNYTRFSCVNVVRKWFCLCMCVCERARERTTNFGNAERE